MSAVGDEHIIFRVKHLPSSAVYIVQVTASGKHVARKEALN
jgi:hypothetical protein